MKKILICLLLLSVLFSINGCSATNTSQTKAETPRTDPTPLSSYAIAQASYPKMAPYPNEMKYVDGETGVFDDQAYMAAYDAWWADQQSRQEAIGYADSLTGFLEKSIPQFLIGDGESNRIYSPPNVYLALGMLAELTDSNSRQQILNLLDSENIETLRAQAKSLWTANYCDDGATSTILASSLWLNEELQFIPSTLNTLTDIYYASSYQGKMGSEDFNKALQHWLNEQTGGLLTNQTAEIEMTPQTVLALATTVYFRAKWNHDFSEEHTTPQNFYTPFGEIVCDFMHQSGTNIYYWGDQFSAVSKHFADRESMYFILPDEGVTPEALLEDKQLMEFFLQKNDWENSQFLIVNLSIPKFDITSQLDLRAGLQALCVTDVFDDTISDFTPLTTDTDEIFLSKAQHDARVSIDEEGCTAAAHTVMMMDAGSAMPPEEEVDFVLNRPFLFAITGYDGLPLFVGIVNQPVPSS